MTPERAARVIVVAFFTLQLCDTACPATGFRLISVCFALADIIAGEGLVLAGMSGSSF